MVIATAAVVLANVLLSAFDVKSISTPNEFITAMIHSDSVVVIVEKLKFILALFIGGLGCCFGLLSFGIGMILSRLRKLSGKLA